MKATIDKADIEKSAAYKQLFDMWAWKDFMKEIESHRENAITRLMSLADDNSTPFKMGEIRGIINEIDAIRKHLHFVTRDSDGQ